MVEQQMEERENQLETQMFSLGIEIPSSRICVRVKSLVWV